MKKELYDPDGAIKELKGLYFKELLSNFVKAGRYDLLLGYAITEKGGQIDSLGNLIFCKKTTVEVPERDLAKYKPDEITKFTYIPEHPEGRKVKPQHRYSKDVYTTYTDRQTEALVAIYKAFIKGSDVKPCLDWEDEANEYVSGKYMHRMEELQAELMEKGKGFDMISFAKYVPYANIGLLEDKIISYNDSLKILAFATDVKGANIDKLREAIERIGNTEVERKTIKYRGQVFVEDVPIDHVGMFREKFGTGQKPTERD